MIVKLLTEHHLEFLGLIGGCIGSSESTLVKMSHGNLMPRLIYCLICVSSLYYRTTPVGVASLVAKSIATTDNLEEEFRKLGIYTATCVGGLAAWVFIVIPIVYIAIRRQNPFKFYFHILQPIMIVFATTST